MPRCRTDGRIAVGICELGALGGKPVQVWRAYMIIAIAALAVPGMVVAYYHDNMPELLQCAGRTLAAGKKRKGQGPEGNFAQMIIHEIFGMIFCQ